MIICQLYLERIDYILDIRYVVTLLSISLSWLYTKF